MNECRTHRWDDKDMTVNTWHETKSSVWKEHVCHITMETSVHAPDQSEKPTVQYKCVSWQKHGHQCEVQHECSGVTRVCVYCSFTWSWSMSESPVMTMRFSMRVSDWPPFSVCQSIKSCDPQKYFVVLKNIWEIRIYLRTFFVNPAPECVCVLPLWCV